MHVERCNAVPEEILRGPERQTQDATVSSLRADTVLAAMMRISRSIAAQAIQSGRVEVNHVPLRTAHEDVFEGDIFTVRGVGATVWWQSATKAARTASLSRFISIEPKT